VLYTKVKNYDIIIVYYEKNNKGEYIMSKIKQYIETSVENTVDKIIKTLKDGQIDFDTCKSKILELDNLSMVGIDSENVDEVISENI
tara:strand:+ start:83 stop:343 length:261 start_codon:yes stop_codon:yes gene_type:complete